ncbi:hypothetical protein F6X53_08165 [Methylobacterium soli]|uniref:Uncharacterized protein n=1 Tax=Methylobacterium soli TaxID=553447 RepID=A0A6L3T2C6_9HYPH|nr:hypothetical protein F6X53_08165 [Methylobacterium soli]
MPHLSRPGVVESAIAERVRGATSPDSAHPSPQPSPARERGSVAPNRTGAADFPAGCNAIGRGSRRRNPGWVPSALEPEDPFDRTSGLGCCLDHSTEASPVGTRETLRIVNP